MLPKINTMISILLCISFLSFGQEYSDLKDVDYASEHEIFLKKQYPHTFDKIQIEGVKQVNDRYAVIAFQNNDEYYEVLVNSGRKEMLLVARFYQLHEDEMPDIVVDQAKESGVEPVAFYEVTEPDSEQYYAVETENDNISNRLYFNRFGQKKKSPL